MNTKIIATSPASAIKSSATRVLKSIFPWAFDPTADEHIAEIIKPLTKPSMLLNNFTMITDPSNKKKRKISITNAQLNNIFKMYLELSEVDLKLDGPKSIDLLGQFNVVYTNPEWSTWHELNKNDQKKALQRKMKLLPLGWDSQLNKMGEIIEDTFKVHKLLNEVYQNSVDSFSLAAAHQQKYRGHFPGFKVILFADHQKKHLRLVLVDNGYGQKFKKPKLFYSGGIEAKELSSPKFSFALLHSFRPKFLKKNEQINQHNTAISDVGFVGGQGKGLAQLTDCFGLSTKLYTLGTGAVVETIFEGTSYF